MISTSILWSGSYNLNKQYCYLKVCVYYLSTYKLNYNYNFKNGNGVQIGKNIMIL